MFTSHRPLLLFVLTFECLQIIYGQQRIHNTTFIDTEIGLHETTNYFTYLDTRSQLWISSLSGLYLYNGNTSLNISQDSIGQNINGNFIEDNHQNIWFTSSNGLHKIEPLNNSVSTYKASETPNLHFLIEFNGRNQLYLTYGLDLYSFNILTESFHKIHSLPNGSQRFAISFDQNLNPNYIASYCLDATYEGIKITYLNPSNSSKKTATQHATSIINKPVRGCILDSNRGLFVITDKELIRFSSDLKSKEQIDLKGASKSLTFTSISLSENKVAIGTFEGSIITVNLNNNEVIIYKIYEGQSPLGSSIQACHIDHHGGIWASTPNKGIAVIHPDLVFFHFHKYNLSTDYYDTGFSPNSFVEIDDDVWISSNTHGVFTINKSLDISGHYHSGNSTMLYDISSKSLSGYEFQYVGNLL